MSKRDELADAIRQAVKVGHVGPNSATVVERGGTFALTPDEANAAADRMLTWLAARDTETKAAAWDEGAIAESGFANDYPNAMPGFQNPYREARTARQCDCRLCYPDQYGVILCPDCGNKRCPKTTSHLYMCSKSNEPGQIGQVAETSER